MKLSFYPNKFLLPPNFTHDCNSYQHSQIFVTTPVSPNLHTPLGLTPPGSVSNASNTNQVAGGLLEPECVLRTSETKRLRLSPCESESSLTLTGSATAIDSAIGNGTDATASPSDLPGLRLFGSGGSSDRGERIETDADSSPRSAAGRDEDVTEMMGNLENNIAHDGSLVQDLSTKVGGSRRPSASSSPIDVPASPPVSAPATPHTSSSSAAPLDDAGDTNLIDQDQQQQPVSIIVRTGAGEYELRWEQLESLFK